PLPPLSAVRAYSSSHLVEAAIHWDDAAERWHGVYSQVKFNAGSLDWSGLASSAARERLAADFAVVQKKADQLHEAAKIARNEASNLDRLARRVGHTADRAIENGFAVGEDYTVTDMQRASSPGRQAQAQSYAADLLQQVTAFTTHEEDVATKLAQAAGGVHTLEFPDENPMQAKPGQEWHYYISKGWQLEGPLENCSGKDEAWDIAIASGGIFGASRFPPGGFLGMIDGGKAIDHLVHCEPPGGTH
ncbi:MAG: hypothetical protein J2P17_18045, partial [Mycobacterium sp.]|nr:hypothetical protein [Mycobacterium sp.]